MNYFKYFVFIILILLLSGCAAFHNWVNSNENRGYWDDRTKQIAAKDQDSVTTKISYNIFTQYFNNERGEYGVFLYNGYDKPVEIQIKYIWADTQPTYSTQYIYSKQEARVQLGYDAPVKIEIYSIVFK